MSYLRYTTEQQAVERNIVEAIRRGCDMVTTRYWWPMVQDGTDYLLNVGDGDGLTADELARMEDEIQ
jgi:hypothetical protein